MPALIDAKAMAKRTIESQPSVTQLNVDLQTMMIKIQEAADMGHFDCKYYANRHDPIIVSALKVLRDQYNYDVNWREQQDCFIINWKQTITL